MTRSSTHRRAHLFLPAIIVVLVVLAGSSVALRLTSSQTNDGFQARLADPAGHVFLLLQMNLCNSGMATSCYSFGKAIDEAAATIRRYAPDLVTAQEICRDDVYADDGWGPLARAMADLHGSERISASFVPARHPESGRPIRCLNGEEFGLALIHHGDGREARHGWYDSQDVGDEHRAWICDTIIAGRLTGCTTHLTSTNPDIALHQCRELMEVLRSPWVMPEVVVAGDLNLRIQPGDPYDLQQCGSTSQDLANSNDGGVQHVYATRSINWAGGGTEAMAWTDHPLLYQGFRFPAAVPEPAQL